MTTDEYKKLPALERVAYWVTERESVRLKKEAGLPPPYTTDPVISRYRFCNVRRADDKVSRWLQAEWYTPNFGHPNMLLACALARFVNKPETLAFVGFPKRWDPAAVKKKLRRWRDAGNTVFNAAYMVRGNNGVDKIQSVVDYDVTPLRKLRKAVDPSSMENTWAALKGSHGFGSFMAGQTVADLRWAVPGSWADRHDWAPMGPGSKRGMNLLHGRPKEQGLSQDKFLAELRQLVADLKPLVPASIIDRLEAIDYQSILCEVSGNEKVHFEGRRKKQLYPGRG